MLAPAEAMLGWPAYSRRQLLGEGQELHDLRGQTARPMCLHPVFFFFSLAAEGYVAVLPQGWETRGNITALFPPHPLLGAQAGSPAPYSEDDRYFPFVV